MFIIKASLAFEYPAKSFHNLFLDNGGEVKRFSRKDASVALAKGLHEIKVVFCSHIIGGWPSAWDDASINIRKADAEKFTPIKAEQLFY